MLPKTCCKRYRTPCYLPLNVKSRPYGIRPHQTESRCGSTVVSALAGWTWQGNLQIEIPSKLYSDCTKERAAVSLPKEKK